MSNNEKIALLQSFRNEIVGHHGVNRTLEILRSAGVSWPILKKEVSDFIGSCLTCQKIKYSKNLFTGDLHYHIHGTHPMQSISCDTVGPLPEDEFDNKFILGIVDNFSKFIELFPVKSTEAQEYVTSIISHIGLFGVPKSV